MPYVDSGGVRVFYTETGSGLTVLWHTGGCGDARMWQRAGYIEGLPGYRHILFDHRGHGRSQAPEGMAGHAPRPGGRAERAWAPAGLLAGRPRASADQAVPRHARRRCLSLTGPPGRSCRAYRFPPRTRLRSALRSSFPTLVSGTASRMVTSRGYLCAASRSRANSVISAGVA